MIDSFGESAKLFDASPRTPLVANSWRYAKYVKGVLPYV